MQFVETPIKGAYVIILENNEDHRGSFAQLFSIEHLIRQQLWDTTDSRASANLLICTKEP